MTHPDKDIRKKAEEILINWTNVWWIYFKQQEIYRSIKQYEWQIKSC